MRKYLLSSFLFLFIITVCGAPPESEKTEHGAEGAYYYQPLTATELQKFLKAFPVFKTEAKRASLAWERLGSPQHFAQWVEQISMGAKDIAGLDAKLSAAGMQWDEFWSAFGKTMVTFSAVMYDSAMIDMKKELEEEDDEVAELEARLRDPNTSEEEKNIIAASLDMRRRMKQRLKEAEDLYTKVPQANKELVKEHLQDLMAIFQAK